MCYSLVNETNKPIFDELQHPWKNVKVSMYLSITKDYNAEIVLFSSNLAPSNKQNISIPQLGEWTLTKIPKLLDQQSTNIPIDVSFLIKKINVHVKFTKTAYVKGASKSQKLKLNLSGVTHVFV